MINAGCFAEDEPLQEIIGISELAVRKKESRKQVEIVGMCKKLGFLGLKKRGGVAFKLGSGTLD